MDIINNNLTFLMSIIALSFSLSTSMDFYSSQIRLESFLTKNIAKGIYRADFINHSRKLFIFFIPPFLGYVSIILKKEFFVDYILDLLFIIATLNILVAFLQLYLLLLKIKKKK